MNKKECNEIRKLFTPANCAISRICGCYVDNEKTKRTRLREAFLSLPEEEAFKYFTIFRNALSGSLEKNLLNLAFPSEAEEEGGCQSFLLKLRDSALMDDALVEEFYDRVIENFAYPENYYIILICGAYDIPARASDGQEMFDASDYVYSFIQCTICPVKLSKGSLWYNSLANVIENRSRDWLVEAPLTGFLFPAFNERSTDIHSVLYYIKKPQEVPEQFVEAVLGCPLPAAAEDQKELFKFIVEETLGENCDFETIKNIHEEIGDLIEETKDDGDALVLDEYRIRAILEENGASPEKLGEIENLAKDGGLKEEEPVSLIASNVVSTRGFDIKTPDVTIKVARDKIHLVETRVVDGRPCVVIAINEGVELNGIALRLPVEKARDGQA